MFRQSGIRKATTKIFIQIFEEMDIQVSSTSVVSLIQQYLKENKLLKTLNTLQEESGVSMDIVDSIECICRDLKRGKWDSVISRLSCVSLPADIADDIYEQMYLEFIEKGDTEICKYLLSGTKAFQDMKSRDPLSGIRFKRLESLLATLVGIDIYRGSSRNERRIVVAEKLKDILRELPSGRLMTLLGDAFSHQRSLGILPLGPCRVDLLTGNVTKTEHIAQKIVSVVHHIDFPKGSVPNCCIFANNLLITGSSDGLVEVWDSGKLDLSLQYQARGNFIVHPSSISCMGIDVENKFFVCGDVKGDIRVWNVVSGNCIKEFKAAHAEAITAICFSESDSSQIISASVGGSIRKFGINSGLLLKEYCPTSSGYVTDFAVLGNWDLVAAFSDGKVTVFSCMTGSIIADFQPSAGDDGPEQLQSVTGVSVVKSTISEEEYLLICTKGARVYLSTVRGVVLKTFAASGDQLTSCTVSNTNDNFYCSSASGKVYTFSIDHDEPKYVMAVTDAELTSICQKRDSNEVAVCSSKCGAYILGNQ